MTTTSHYTRIQVKKNFYSTEFVWNSGLRYPVRIIHIQYLEKSKHVVPSEEQFADEVKGEAVEELLSDGREARICCWKRRDRMLRSVGREPACTPKQDAELS